MESNRKSVVLLWIPHKADVTPVFDQTFYSKLEEIALRHDVHLELEDKTNPVPGQSAVPQHLLLDLGMRHHKPVAGLIVHLDAEMEFAGVTEAPPPKTLWQKVEMGLDEKMRSQVMVSYGRNLGLSGPVNCQEEYFLIRDELYCLRLPCRLAFVPSEATCKQFPRTFEAIAKTGLVITASMTESPELAARQAMRYILLGKKPNEPKEVENETQQRRS